jgi:Type II secretion system (T2SS), protein K
VKRITASRTPARARALATLSVLWAIALVMVVLVGVQSVAFRQAAGGREVVARTRALWAARAGLEAQIAALTAGTLSPDTTNAYTLNADLAAVSTGALSGASYRVQHVDEKGTLVDGPLDAHARLNVNLLSPADLMALDSMDETAAQSIINWVQGGAADDTGAGADAGAYRGLRFPIEPRGDAFRSLREIELIIGVSPDLLRGEDANYNNLLDPSEDDGNLSPPADNADGKLDQGWGAYLTTVSELGGTTLAGEARLNLRTATSEQIVARVRVDQTQAQTIRDHVQAGGTMPDFIRAPLATYAAQPATQGNTLQLAPNVRELTRDQQRTLLDECSDGSETDFSRSGKLNVNTVPRKILERVSRVDVEIIDALLTDRDGRSSGYQSMIDLLEVPGISTDELATLMEFMDVRSNVFVVSSRGRDDATGLEVEIVAVIDRSSLPVIIRDLVVR